MAEHPTIDYRIGQDNIRPFGLDIHNPVFVISSLVIIAFVALTLAMPAQTESFFGWLRPWLTSTFDWWFMTAANIFVLFCLLLVVTPYGGVRLGGREARPDYSYLGWFAMLFSAGMGIGLMFFGVLEPVVHFQTPPLGYGAEAAAAAAAVENGANGANGVPAITGEMRDIGMAGAIFHWGLHPWAIYAVVALSLAFFAFNRGLPLTIRSAFYPIFGNAVWGWLGHVIDTLAVFATLFGLATSLGFGAEQASAGLDYLFGIPATDGAKVVLILGITAVALVSVWLGLDRGVKRLSELNMTLAALLLLFVIAFGATIDIFTGAFSGTATYVTHLPQMSFWFGRDDYDFMHGWTTFYWAWWISWSPFVGMFIARVSRGRTVREFIICVLIVPTIACILWMSAFGGTAISQIVNDGYMGVSDAVTAWTPELSLFLMLEPLPLTWLTSFVGITLVIVFFVTSSDSGSLVIDTITAGGKMDAPVVQRLFWCTFEGLVAIALLLGGGLGSLQAAAIATGFPFALVLLVMCFSTFQGLRSEPR